MINNKDNKSGYQFLSIVLLKSKFERIANITTDTNQIEANINIDRKNQIQDHMINVILELSFQTLNKETRNKEIDASITMVGKFIQSGETELDIQSFAQKNAPAIMFPYLREHLSSLSLRAGVPPIILPPINFVQLDNDKQIEKKH